MPGIPASNHFPHLLQPEVVEHVLEPYRLYGPDFSFLQDLDSFLSEYDEGFAIPLQHGARPIRHLRFALSSRRAF